MNQIIESLSEKFNSIDPNKIEKDWKEIEKSGEGADPKRVEDVLKMTPGFTAIDMINFGEYCRSGFDQYQWEEKEIIDHLTDWLNKIKE
jgi:hypothetical protein